MNGEARGRVLVVDDDPGVRRFLEAVLRRGGHEVVVAVSGEDALTRLAEATPVGIVLLDAVLPDVRGYDLARRLIDEPSTASLPICFLTGSIQGRTRPDAGVGCVAKPASPEEILDAVAQLITWTPSGSGDGRDLRHAALRRIEERSLL